MQIDHEFQAAPMLAYDRREMNNLPLNSKKLRALIADADPRDFSLGISLLDPEDWRPMLGFELSSRRMTKGGVFEVAIDEKAKLATVKVHGEIATDLLFVGVAPIVQKQGEKADFRLQEFNFKGGERSGFTAPIHGQKEDDFKNWYQIKSWKLK